MIIIDDSVPRDLLAELLKVPAFVEGLLEPIDSSEEDSEPEEKIELIDEFLNNPHPGKIEHIVSYKTMNCFKEPVQGSLYFTNERSCVLKFSICRDGPDSYDIHYDCCHGVLGCGCIVDSDTICKTFESAVRELNKGFVCGNKHTHMNVCMSNQISSDWFDKMIKLSPNKKFRSFRVPRNSYYPRF